MKRWPLLLYIGIALGITLPLFKPGFVFLLDMVYTPRIDLVDSMRNGIHAGIPLAALQAALNTFLPAEIIQKMALFVTVLLPGVGMFLLARNRMPLSYAIGAGLIYQLNPYVYERFVAGQWHVLLGYGFFPIVLHLFLSTLHATKETRFRYFLSFAVAFSIYPLLSLHWATLAGEFIAALGILQIILTRKMPEKMHWRLREAEILAFIFFLCNAFWLWNYFGHPEGQADFSKNDFFAFETASDPLRGTVLNVLNMYGFWNMDFLLPKDIIPLWWVLGPVLILLSVLGTIALLKKKKDALTLMTIITFPFALVFSIGYATPLTQEFVDGVYAVIPFMAGLRDTAKVIGVLVFAYALLAPAGLMSIENRIGRKGGLIIVFLLPFLMAGPLLWGAMGQIKTAPYPSDWEEVETLLGKDAGVLIVPWAQYLRLDFAEGALAANPARNYFSANIITGKNTDNPFLYFTEQSRLNEAMVSLVHGVETVTSMREFLKSYGITHIVLLKTDEWEAYQEMLKDPSLENVFQRETIEVFRLE